MWKAQTHPRVRSEVKVQIDASFPKDLAWNKSSDRHGLFALPTPKPVNSVIH